MTASLLRLAQFLFVVFVLLCFFIGVFAVLTWAFTGGQLI